MLRGGNQLLFFLYISEIINKFNFQNIIVFDKLKYYYIVGLPL